MHKKPKNSNIRLFKFQKFSCFCNTWLSCDKRGYLFFLNIIANNRT